MENSKLNKTCGIKIYGIKIFEWKDEWDFYPDNSALLVALQSNKYEIDATDIDIDIDETSIASIPVLAKYEDGIFYEMVTGKELKKWDAGPYDFSKYVYYDSYAEIGSYFFNEVCEGLKLVNSSEENLKQYIRGLLKKEVEASKKLPAREEEIKRLQDELDEDESYLQSYKRPNR